MTKVIVNSVGPPSHSPGETGLGTDRMRRRINQIAQARARGLGDHIALPQVAICGDQSAGKSSVLEGITSVPFPRKDGLCTRFATEIISRRVPRYNTSIIASIIPHSSRDQASFNRLKDYNRTITGFEQLADVIEDVSIRMGLKGYTDNDDYAPAFVADILRIEVTGPSGLDLAIVDLPGLIEGSEDSEAVQLVGNLVDSYLKEPRTIILAVFPAGSDIETQPIIRRARAFDHIGERTVGIITKADLINSGTEARIAALIKNQGPIKMDMGFFLLKNPSPDQLSKGISAEQRYIQEEEYFQRKEWKTHGLKTCRIGARALRSYCQTLLERHFERQMPKLREELSELVERCERELVDLGEERDTPLSQKLYLSKLSMRFCELVRFSIDGRYHDYGSQFFEHDRDNPLQNRLRARVHLLNTDFAGFMRDSSPKRLVTKGEAASNVVSFEFDLDSNGHHLIALGKPKYVSVEEFNEWVMSVS